MTRANLLRCSGHLNSPFEVCDGERAFEFQQQTPHFQKYFAEVAPLLASRERQVVTKAFQATATPHPSVAIRLIS